MRTLISLLAVVVLVAGLACQAAVSSTAESSAKTDAPEKAEANPVTSEKETEKSDSHSHDDEDDVERISIADAKKAFDAGEAVIIDSRSKESYENSHIKGSINIPVGEMAERYKEIPKGKKIIVYCS